MMPTASMRRGASVVHFERVESLHDLLLDKEARKRQFCELYDESQPVAIDAFKEDRRRLGRTVSFVNVQRVKELGDEARGKS